jgi:hypothetical protein
MKLPEIFQDTFVDPVTKKYQVGFPDSKNRFMRQLKFDFINHKDALMFARGINSFTMTNMGVRNSGDFISRGSQTAYLIQNMQMPLSKAHLLKGRE